MSDPPYHLLPKKLLNSNGQVVNSFPLSQREQDFTRVIRHRNGLSKPLPFPRRTRSERIRSLTAQALASLGRSRSTTLLQQLKNQSTAGKSCALKYSGKSSLLSALSILQHLPLSSKKTANSLFTGRKLIARFISGWNRINTPRPQKMAPAMKSTAASPAECGRGLKASRKNS